MEKLTPPQEEARRTRADGEKSRERLLLAAMRLFAEQGFAKTSTREIALAAGTNIASISYYFGDKAGLYRAAFTEPSPHPQTQDLAKLGAEGTTLRQALAMFYAMLLGPLKQGDMARLCMRLWFREMLEPTGLWHEEINTEIKPSHDALVQLLARHMQAEPDDDIARLAFCLVGMAIQLMVGRDVVEQLHPQLLDSDAALDTWTARLVDYAEAMIQAEQARRTLAAPTTAPTSKPKPAPRTRKE